MSLQEQLLDQANRLHRESGGGGDSGIDIDAQLARSRATSRRARRNSRLALIAQRRDVVAGGAGDGDSDDSDSSIGSIGSVGGYGAEPGGGSPLKKNKKKTRGKRVVATVAGVWVDADDTTKTSATGEVGAAASAEESRELSEELSRAAIPAEAAPAAEEEKEPPPSIPNTLEKGSGRGGPANPLRRQSATRVKPAAVSRRRRSITGSSALSHLCRQGDDDDKESVLSPIPAAADDIIDNVIAVPEGPAQTQDLTQLASPTHDNVLSVLSERHKAGLIYTTVGDCLLSINPYRWIPALYKPDIVEAHLSPSSEAGAKKYPHVYQIANDALIGLQTSGQNQSIVIVGESGSGKTENMKKCLQFFTRISCDVNHDGGNDLAAVVESSGVDSGLERMILATNPLLEAYGNAKTVRNDNSSRFGRWIEITFRNREVVVGCSCTAYLLEKARVSKQQPGDRNFHIFYMMIAGANEAQRRKYSLMPVRLFNYLSSSSEAASDAVNNRHQDASRFAELLEAAEDVCLGEDELHNLLHYAASCLHLGNISFDVIDRGSCKVHVPTADERKQMEADVEHGGEMADALAVASRMLGLDANELSTALCFRTIQMRASGEEMQVPMTHEKAMAARDAFAKSIYARLFLWLVARLNKTLPTPSARGQPRSKATDGSAATTLPLSNVGMLDIFGFEIMAINNFEQLCINYTNEKLQHFFNRYTFTEEAALYAREGLAIPQVEFTGNIEVLQLFEKRGIGLLALLDEELIRPSGNDKSFCRKASQKNAQHRNYEKSRFSDVEFTIRHFAGDVAYLAEGFLDKNRDRLQDNLVACARSSDKPFLAEVLFAVGADGGQVDKTLGALGGESLMATRAKLGKRHTVATGSREKRGTRSANRVTNSIASQLRGSVNLLIKRLETTRPHFIRCIKPNSTRSPTEFNRKMVLHQLRCLGVLEAIQAQQTGFPVRLSHRNFAERYRICGLSGAHGTSRKVSTMLEGGRYLDSCKFLLDGGLRDLNGGALKDIFVGKTMVLYRPIHRDILETLRRRGQNRAVVVLQCVVRLHRAAKQVKRRRAAKDELSAVLNNFSQNDVNMVRLRTAIKTATSIEGMKERPWPELVEAQEMLGLLEKRRTIVDRLCELLEIWGIDPFSFQSLSEFIRAEKGTNNASEAGLMSDPRSDKFIKRLEECLEDAAQVNLGGAPSLYRAEVNVEGVGGDSDSIEDGSASIKSTDSSTATVSVHVPLLEAAKSVRDAARERLRLRAVVKEALSMSTRNALMNALETIRVSATKYGDEFVHEDLTNVHELLRHIDREKKHVEALRVALSSSGVRGAVGRLDTSRIQFAELQGAIQRSSHSALKTVQARCLLRIARALYDVRHAVSIDDWPKCYTAFDHLLGTIDAVSTLVGGRIDHIGIPPSAAGEIEILSEEVRERRFCEALEKALVDGRIAGITGNLDCSRVNPDKLMEVLAGAAEHVASPRGTAMQNLAQTMLSLRMAACAGNWDTVAQILPEARARAKQAEGQAVPKSSTFRVAGDPSSDQKTANSGRMQPITGPASYTIVRGELGILKNQLAYEAQTRLLVAALNGGAVLSLEYDPASINLKDLDDAIEQSAACKYKAHAFTLLIAAARRTRDLRASLRASDWSAFERTLNELQEVEGDHGMIIPGNVREELRIMGLILKCHTLEVQVKAALLNRRYDGEYIRDYRNRRDQVAAAGLGSSEIADDWTDDCSDRDTKTGATKAAGGDEEDSLTTLQNFVFAANELQHKTKDVEALYWSVNHILRLRKALSSGDWVTAKSAISDVSKGDYEIVAEAVLEIREAERRVINLELAAGLQQGLETGIISMSERQKGRIDRYSIEYTKLEKALKKGSNLDSALKHTRLVELERVCEFMMNVRKLVWEGEWARCEEFIADAFETAEERIRKLRVATSMVSAAVAEAKRSRGFTIRTLLGDRLRYPLVHDEVRRVQTEIARRYVCERMLRAISEGRLRNFQIQVGFPSKIEMSISGEPMSISSQRNVRWDCSWETSNNFSIDAVTKSHAVRTQKMFQKSRRTSVGSRIVSLAIDDNAQSLSSIESTDAEDSMAARDDGSLSDLRGAISLAKAVVMQGNDDKLIERTAEIIYDLRTALRDGDEGGVDKAITQAQQGRILLLAQQELRTVSESMRCLHNIRKICAVLGHGKAGEYQTVQIAPLESAISGARSLLARLRGSQSELDDGKAFVSGYETDIMSYLTSDASWRSDMGRSFSSPVAGSSGDFDADNFEDPYTSSYGETSSRSLSSTSSAPSSGRRCLAEIIRCAELILQLRHAYLRDDVHAVHRFCQEVASLQLEDGPGSIVKDEVEGVRQFMVSRAVRNRLCAALLTGHANSVRRTILTKARSHEQNIDTTIEPVDVSAVSTVHLEEAIISAERLEEEIKQASLAIVNTTEDEKHKGNLTRALAQIARHVLRLRRSLKRNDARTLRQTLNHAERELPRLTDKVLADDPALEQAIRSVLKEFLSARKELQFQALVDDLNISRETGRAALLIEGNDIESLRYRAMAARNKCNEGLLLLDRKAMEDGMRECESIGMEVSNGDDIRRLLALPEQRFHSLKLQAAVSRGDSMMVGRVVARMMSPEPGSDAGPHDDPNSDGDMIENTLGGREAPLGAEAIAVPDVSDPRLERLIQGWLGRRGVSYPIACLHDLIGTGVLGQADKIFALWVSCLTTPFGKGGWDLSDAEGRQAWAGFGACLSFMPVGAGMEAAVLHCCQRHEREDLVEKLCAGIWKRQEGVRLTIPTIGEVERAVDRKSYSVASTHAKSRR